MTTKAILFIQIDLYPDSQLLYQDSLSVLISGKFTASGAGRDTLELELCLRCPAEGG